MNFKKLNIVCFAALLMLNGCATFGPEADGYSQASAISGKGGIYKVGNPYQIFGKWYYPKEDYGYSEEGVASWYGEDFHAKKTANGEKYDMHTLTAAHRTLPLPSIVKVTNLDNGRSLILRVNDRGPYAKSRIIDISKRGAQLLGYQGRGTANVRVEVLEKESKQLKAALTGGKIEPTMYAKSAPIKKLEPLEAGQLSGYTTANKYAAEKMFFVQAGAFSKHEAAKDLSSQLSKFGKSKIAQADIGGSRFYRVRIGPFNFKEEAEVTLAKVKNFGIDNAKVVHD